MREYTVQWLNDTHDWTRVTAIYSTLEDASHHGRDLLESGFVARILGRNPNEQWHTVKIHRAGFIVLDKIVHNCPS